MHFKYFDSLETFTLPNPLTGHSAFLFDCDGLLLDTEPLYTAASCQLIAELGAIRLPRLPAPLKLSIMGRTRLSVAQKLTDWLRLEHQILCSAAEWSARVLAFEERLFAAGCPVLPGAREIIHLLHKRERRLAVATSSNRRSFQIKTAPHQESLFSRFSVIVCGDELECPGQCKPHPRIFQKAHAALDPACASVALAFEDSPNGVIAALRANCDVIWVPGEEVRGAAGLVGALEEVIEDEQCAGEIDSERFVLRLGSILELIN